MNKILTKLDLFSTDPEVLRFGDPAKDQSGRSSKSWIGGVSSLCFIAACLSYLYIASLSLFNGKGNIYRSVETGVDVKIVYNLKSGELMSF